eukprot:31905-Eustigmatos_ZCMA.PRE.1
MAAAVSGEVSSCSIRFTSPRAPEEQKTEKHTITDDVDSAIRGCGTSFIQRRDTTCAEGSYVIPLGISTG